jgi:tRNA threonylcarbamoyl adenosine modification protein YjeE
MPHTSAGASASFRITLTSEQELPRLVADIGNALEPGNLVTLSGDLGAGKTTFARALIRHLAQDPDIAVPSPTFTLMQSYDLPRFPLVHADFYRLAGPSELTELGFDDLTEETVILLEWPDRAGGHLAADRIDIAFALAPGKGLSYRDVRITGYGALAPRVTRIGQLRDFLSRSGYANTARTRLQGDASTRFYERLSANGESVILMNAPRRADGPALRDGKSYSAIAHLAEDVQPFVAIAHGLQMRGFSAPEILAADLDHGFLIVEDFGGEPVVTGTPPAPVEMRYQAAVETLLALHTFHLPNTLPVTAGTDYKIPSYDLDAMLIEVELLADWYLPHAGIAATEATRMAFRDLWRETLQPVLQAPRTWVLRDFHSPNLIWLGEREGIRRIGLIDFQDAAMGPAAYDLASLLQDARVDVPEALELKLFTHYCRSRMQHDPRFPVAAFAETYAILAAQRASKILGIFARLDRRDGKPQYLRHMPRIWDYLQRALNHPSLMRLRAFYAAHIPAPF